MALNDLTNQNIQDTYQKVIQTDGVNLADGTGSALPIKFDGPDLIVSGALRAQSYIVSESVTVVTSGSTAFGDTSDDSHTFIGNITSSGTISASGMIQTAGAISSSTGITASDAFFSNDITSSGNISSSGTITADGYKVVFNGAPRDLFSEVNNSLQWGEQNITSYTIGKAGGVALNDLTIHSNITASGTISASVMIQTAGAISSSTGITSSGAFFSGNVTASGTISSSGTITGQAGLIQYRITGDTDGTHQGDVVFFGGTTSMTTGAIYHYKSDGTWELADADDNTKSDGLLGVALGAASDVNGVLLRGMVTLDHDPGAVGDVLFLSTTAGDCSATSPSGNNEIVRVIGYCLHASNGQIWFNPDSTFIEITA